MLKIFPGLLACLMLLVSSAALAATLQLPVTGQTVCYEQGACPDLFCPVPCGDTHAGQDGAVQAGVQAPATRFTDNGDGTLTDNQTDLVWLQDLNCLTGASWQQALDRGKTLADAECGLGDGSRAGQWRLPNRRELLSLTNFERGDGGTWLVRSLPAGADPLDHWYWTSDSYIQDAAAKWIYHPAGALWPSSDDTQPDRVLHALYVRDPLRVNVTVTAAVGAGSGTVTPETTIAIRQGETASFNLAPATGYLIMETVGGTCPAGSFQGATYTTGPVTADCSLLFSFEQAPNMVTFIAGEGGSISGAMEQRVAPGGNTTPVAAVPNPGFRFVQWTEPSGFTSTSNPLVVTEIASNRTITASFAADTYGMGDVVRVFRHAMGRLQLTDSEKARYDLAPLGPDGVSRPDGSVGFPDVVILLRRLVGL
ncbi:DUF1566 domain-containing protein [Geobacter sp. DSM 9736]|uniref:DUF1566 domain-containing protein n=1 Tax=Geobacter sp. DSM 9736 TaxID=1277350 RepID=UPI000B5E0F54|nr:DUF1566 domain-containing protein [Geobacter sp. DSM 9736]SNB46050.1 Protein of unknown function [Geobacter sp. DSM 9736]